MDPVSLIDILTATRAESAGIDDAQRVVTRVSVDSRTLESGDLFWALCGAKHDGHRFTSEALRRGAVA
ncbi:MAG: hypothetical protein HY290_01150 [Planctomycetia bacterium]|nr:hypothetical protein [Planctomycetia bacterium]